MEIYFKLNTYVEKHYAPAATKSKTYSKHTGKSQGHQVIDLGVIWKGIISWVYLSSTKFSSLTVQKL